MNNSYLWSIPKVRSAIEFAMHGHVVKQLLPGVLVRGEYRDSKCSDTYGPLEAIDLYTKGAADVILGPACDFAVAPIARFTQQWEIPVLTAGALVTVR